MKQFFTYAQQIAKLKSDGLIIHDENQTISALKFEGYYNIINGYSPIFKNNGRFINGTSFDNIKQLYDFDKSLRSIVYKYTTSIECHIKALIAHEFSKVHGVDEKIYLTPVSFSQNQNSQSQIVALIADCQQTITDALNQSSKKYREYIAHNFYNHGHVPLWVLIRALSFGTTSIFYKNMLEPEKIAIANTYSLTPPQLANMLEVVVSFRNIVAHGERTFCAKLPKTRLSTNLSIIKKLCLPKNLNGSNKYGRNDFLSILVCCKYLLPPLEFASFFSELSLLLDELKIKLPPYMFGKIKTLMGLNTKGWELLPKLKIDEIGTTLNP